MKWDFVFFLNSVLLGVGLAMDAFSVSMANGLNEPNMKKERMNMIAGMYSFFQFAMPMIGWLCVHTIVEKFQAFEKFIPWIALALLAYIGGEMVIKGIRKEESPREEETGLPFGKLLIQGIATSLDALSVGFTIEQYPTSMALVASLIIAVVTHFLCIGGLVIGKKFGNKLADKASIFGGVILIGIGIEIFVSHMV
jgi:putative Mn2+ efflux pump MntP